MATWEDLANKIVDFYVFWFQRNEYKDTLNGGLNKDSWDALRTTHTLGELRNKAVEIVDDTHKCVLSAPEVPQEAKEVKDFILRDSSRMGRALELIQECKIIPPDSQNVSHNNESNCTYAVEEIRYGFHTSSNFRHVTISGCPVSGISEDTASDHIQRVTDDLDLVNTKDALLNQVDWNKKWVLEGGSSILKE